MSDTSNNLSLHTSNGIFEVWSEFIYNEDNDVEMGEADNDPSNVPIQAIQNIFSNWSYRYIPLVNNFIMPNNLDTVGRTVTRSFDEDLPKYKNDETLIMASHVDRLKASACFQNSEMIYLTNQLAVI